METRMNLQQRRADTLRRVSQLMPRGQPALPEKVVRGSIHPSREIREEDNACRIAIAELHVNAEDDLLAHGPMLPFPMWSLFRFHAGETVNPATLGVSVCTEIVWRRG